jgi:hypothetical protein
MASPVGSGPDGRLAEVAGTVETFGRTRFPEAYTGVVLDPHQHCLIVHRRPSATFDTELYRLVAGTLVTVRDARYSEREMLEVLERLRADDAYWRERGLRIAAYGPRADGSGIDLTTPDVDLARRLLPGRYDVEILINQGGPFTPYTR